MAPTDLARVRPHRVVDHHKNGLTAINLVATDKFELWLNLNYEEDCGNIRGHVTYANVSRDTPASVRAENVRVPHSHGLRSKSPGAQLSRQTLTCSPAAMRVIMASQTVLAKGAKTTLGVLWPAGVPPMLRGRGGTRRKRGQGSILKQLVAKYDTFSKSDSFGTGEVVAALMDKVCAETDQFIEGKHVGQGVVGRDIAALTILYEYVGNIFTDDEIRRRGTERPKSYIVSLPSPLARLVIDPVIDPATNETGEANEFELACIAAKMNATTNIRPREYQQSGSLVSNGEGNSRVVCADGDEPNCAFLFARCSTGCKCLRGDGVGAPLHHFHVVIVTVRDISAQWEPLTLDYGDGYWSRQVDVMKCEMLQEKCQELQVQLAASQNDCKHLERQLAGQ